MEKSSQGADTILTFRTLIICAVLLFVTNTVQAADQLLYFEAQGIAGYSSELRKPVYYSMNPDAEMQKPSVGFDYLKRFSGESGDWGTFALQARAALTINGLDGANGIKWEPQVYNAYFKVKTPGPYVWVGHNRPAFGLGSYFDSHGLLLRTLAVQGFGYDRDWGGGLSKDFSWGDIAASLTTGSGMPVYTKGNSMAAARISYGVLSQDNFNLGFSLGYGNTLDTMGYNLLDQKPQEMRLAGADLTILRNSFEHRFDVLTGTWLNQDTYALMYRLGFNVDPEGRLKIEAQPTYWKFGDEKKWQAAFCISSLVTSNLTVRMMYQYDHNRSDNSVVLQFYFYMPVI
ncbi:MAG: hypothetical protein NT178_04700 [Proteobacteria bacterium]|nr:hypothetical protein [Pseudomonadota bacterium]